VRNDRSLKTLSGGEAAETKESIAPVKEPNGASDLGQSASWNVRAYIDVSTMLLIARIRNITLHNSYNSRYAN
jgi:hypothetical protein